ncbi:hypothetical protein RUND412_009513 [Rhizina undulata]
MSFSQSPKGSSPQPSDAPDSGASSQSTPRQSAGDTPVPPPISAKNVAPPTVPSSSIVPLEARPGTSIAGHPIIRRQGTDPRPYSGPAYVGTANNPSNDGGAIPPFPHTRPINPRFPPTFARNSIEKPAQHFHFPAATSMPNVLFSTSLGGQTLMPLQPGEIEMAQLRGKTLVPVFPGRTLEPQARDTMRAMPAEMGVRVLRKSCLKIAEEDIDKPKVGRWTMEETEALVAHLQDRRNYSRLKSNMKRELGKLAKEIFHGTKTVKAIEGRWKTLRDAHQTASKRINSTTEGEIDEAQWLSIRQSWLDQACPFYRELDQILRTDVSSTPSYNAPQNGGSQSPFTMTYGARDDRRNDDDADRDDDHPTTDEEGEESQADSPPAGRSQTPTQRNVPAKKIVKRQKNMLALDSVLKDIAFQKLKHDKEHLEYQKERDKEDRELQREMERMRHEARMKTLNIQEQQMRIQSMQLELALAQVNSLKRGRDEEE